MRGVIAIARREVVDRWILLAIAFALGVVPVVLGLIASAGTGDYWWERTVSPLVVAAMTTTFVLVYASWLVAFVIGMSLIGRPLHDGKLSFYFTRPIPAHAIAIGKVLGGVLVILGVEALLYAPAAVCSVLDLDIGPTLDDRDMLALFALGSLGLGLVVGVLARSRTRWFLLDIAGVGIVVVALLAIARRLGVINQRFWLNHNGDWGRPPGWTSRLLDQEQLFVDQSSGLWLGLSIAAVLALFAGAAAAVAMGRADRERAHAALSTTLWSSVAAIGAIAIGFTQWGM